MAAHWYQTRRLLLRRFPGVPVVDQYASRHGWPKADETVQGGRAIEVIWDLGPEVALHCVDDGVTRNSYVYTSSDVPNFAEAYLQPAEEELETWPVGELIREADRATDPVQRGKAIVRMAIAASYETDEEIARRMSEALRSDDYALRDLTLWAMSICSYPVFRPLLRDIARSDSSEILRQRAQMLLEAYDRAGVGES